MNILVSNYIDSNSAIGEIIDNLASQEADATIVVELLVAETLVDQYDRRIRIQTNNCTKEDLFAMSMALQRYALEKSY